MSKQKIGETGVEFEAGPDGAELTAGDSTVKLDREGNFIGAEAFGNVMEKVEGGMKITRPDGSVMLVHDTGGVTIENLTPKSVGVKSLADIASYVVRQEGQLSIHRIEFVNGGHVEVSYAPNGAVTGCSGHNISQTISKDNEILYGTGDSSSGAVH